jgi:hypothetical protein
MGSRRSTQTFGRSGSKLCFVRKDGALLVTDVQEVLLTHVSRIVPNYDLAPDLGQVDILRVVVKENFTEALLDRLVCDIVCIRAPCCYCPRLTIGR